MSNRLPVLQESARAAHADVGRHLEAAAERALEAGAALIEAKDLCRHGEWGEWLAGAGIPARSATRYMTLARSGMKSAIVAEIGIARAEKWASAGERMRRPEDVAVEAAAHDDDARCGVLSWWWAEGDNLVFTSIVSTPERAELVKPRGPVAPWIAALIHEGADTRFDTYRERDLPVAEAKRFLAELEDGEVVR